MEVFERPWGSYSILFQDENYWTKILKIKPFSALSLQTHAEREEHWTPLDDGLEGYISGWVDLQVGVKYLVPTRVKHRINNPTNRTISLIEVATGAPEESDIIRYEDIYGRLREY